MYDIHPAAVEDKIRNDQVRAQLSRIGKHNGGNCMVHDDHETRDNPQVLIGVIGLSWRIQF